MTTLEKIRAEIEKIKPDELPYNKRTPENIRDMALEIIDKYSEQEPTIRPSFSYTAEINADDEQLERLQGILNGEMVLRLEQEPCDDAISRQAVLEIAKQHTLTNDYLAIQELPSVRPQLNEQAAEWYKLFVEKFDSCDDAISREELLKAIDTWDKFGVDDTNSLFRLDNLSLPNYVPYIHYDDVVKGIKGMPSVRPQEQTGHWIRQDNTKEPLYGWYFCSECNSVIGDKTKFCSNCGAKMVEPTCGTCEYNTAAFTPCNACEDMSEYELRERSDKA